jgi:hypothetical protein
MPKEIKAPAQITVEEAIKKIEQEEGERLDALKNTMSKLLKEAGYILDIQQNIVLKKIQ